MPVVVDASALVELLIRGRAAAAVESALSNQDVLAPDLLDSEVLGAMAGLERRRTITTARAERALHLLMRAPVQRVPSTALILDAWKLRASVSVYSALYVALARRFTCPLVTCDGRLTRSPGLGIPVVLTS